jgi:ribokinase
MGTRSSISLGGKGANQAAAVARLGARSIFVGRTGQDGFGTLARSRLADFGVDVEHLTAQAESTTGMAVISVNQEGENCIVVVGGANSLLDRSDVNRVKTILASARVLLLQLETPLAASLAAAAGVRTAGGIVILDPAPAPAGGLPGEAMRTIDVITPNETETQALVGIRPTTSAEAAEAASRLLALGVPAAVVKMGSHGVFFRNAEAGGFVPPFPVHSINSVGAGDCFNGGLAVALARGDGFADAIRFAAACGALATTGPGAADSAPTMAAVHRLMTAC